MVLDIKHGLVFAACDDGGVTVLDEDTGKLLGRAASGASTAVIAYNEKFAHLYVLEPEEGRLEIVGILKAGTGKILKTVDTEKHSNRIISDDQDQVYVCDPQGRLFTYKDSLPAGM